MNPYRIATTILYARRPLLSPRANLNSIPKFHTSASAHFPTSQTHSTDAYNKDVDTTPPEDSTTYQVDPDVDVQKSTAPPSGEFSRAGTSTSEYENVDTTSQPYAVPGQSQRYGNVDEWRNDKGPETSKPDEGPEGKSSGGRKPEKRS